MRLHQAPLLIQSQTRDPRGHVHRRGLRLGALQGPVSSQQTPAPSFELCDPVQTRVVSKHDKCHCSEELIIITWLVRCAEPEPISRALRSIDPRNPLVPSASFVAPSFLNTSRARDTPGFASSKIRCASQYPASSQNARARRYTSLTAVDLVRSMWMCAP